MNIFVLSEDPVEAAQMQLNKHVVKMVLESAQMLCAPYETGVAPYKRAHYNHPCTIWARESYENYQWLISHALALAEEYTFRYEKTHKSEAVIRWCQENVGLLNLPKRGLTEFAVAISSDMLCRNSPNFNTLSVRDKYRAYYLYDKSYMATWIKRSPPSWWCSV